MDKLLLIIKREYLAKVRNRSFIVMTILSPLLIVGMIAVVVFLTRMNNDQKKVIGILDESTYFDNVFITGPELAFVDFRNLTPGEAKDSVASMGYYGLLHIPGDDTIEAVADGIQFYSAKSPSITVTGMLEMRIAKRLREEKLREIGVSEQMVNELVANFEIPTTTFSGERSVKGINEIKAAIGGGFGYLIMMFIIIYGAFVMRSVIEEKTSRIIEVIISSVKPFQLMLGKIIGTSLAGITQFVIWILSAGVLGFLAFSFMGVQWQEFGPGANLPPEALETIEEASASNEVLQLYVAEMLRIPWLTLIVSFMIYFTLGYLIYSSVYAAIGAAVDNETDTQQFMFPVIMPLMLAVYVGFFSVFENPNGPIAVGFSLFPLTSPIVMLMRLPGGVGADGVPWWQLFASIALLVLTFIGIVWLAARIYRVGILMYGKKPTYKELYKWLRYK